jgi:hypothetical protein
VTPQRYRISIMQDGHHYYRTTGAIAISKSSAPMTDVARALLAKGADAHATLSATTHEGGMVSAVTLARLVRPYRAPTMNHRDPASCRNVD